MYIGKGKGKGHPLQALRHCTVRTAHRGSRSIALPFHDHGTRRGEGQRHAPAVLYSRERPGTHCTEGWVGPRARLDMCGKSRPTPEFDPRTVQPVASRYTDYATRPTIPHVPRLCLAYIINFKFRLQDIWGSLGGGRRRLSSGMWRHVFVYALTDVSGENTSRIFKRVGGGRRFLQSVWNFTWHRDVLYKKTIVLYVGLSDELKCVLRLYKDQDTPFINSRFDIICLTASVV